ncbi:eukaryotic mitochondrial regulator protein-domain-containing protein [Coprinopsis sp. MPI-PUGE-AT-0042]|nr:eukaryotic mitochondrial regulator protein-domain-containing protein [Coprinopsis sp. MPI-PUGE-AT-0042]
MNPSFRPSPPISDVQRDAMYNAYMADPMKNNVRTLAQRYGMSLKRVDAILRLKGLERDWAKNKRLQNGFQAGMEILLGATTHKAATSSRYDINEADILEQDENRDALRQRYQRAYWESVSEAGQEPIVPGSLEHARKRALQYAQSAEDFKTIPQLLPKVPDTEFMKRPTESVVIRQRVGRPSLQFVDVGAKFMDVNERVKQISQASRRASRRRAAAVARSQSWRDTVTEAAEAEVS